jgi:Na+-transporting methylmalonyl-CoA/oxaloacetate decarboxylase gamma subunit
MNLLTIQAGIQDVQTTAQQISETSGSNTSTFIFWGVVVVLIFLFFFFLKRTDKIVEERARREKEQQMNAKVAVQNIDPTEEIAAAIAMAISTYKIQMAELENLTITIQKVSKQYSPWSSKIYTLRQMPK